MHWQKYHMANLLRLSTLCVSFLFTFFHYLSRPLTHSLTVPRTRRRTQYTTVLLAIYIMTYTIIEILPERERYQVSYKAWAIYCAILKEACLNRSVSSPTVRIPAFQAGDPGSTPGWRTMTFFWHASICFSYNTNISWCECRCLHIYVYIYMCVCRAVCMRRCQYI